MLNELITWVLKTYLGKYLEDFNPAQLSVALVSGEVELENVPIRKDALRSFGIPVQALSGSIGKIKLQIPVRQFRSSPWSIVIEKVYGVFGPIDMSQWNSDEEKEAEYDYKQRLLDAMEANWRIDNDSGSESYYSLSYTSWVNYGASLVTNILESLELKVMDVHLRYEDAITLQKPIAAGIRINSILAQSCDTNWVPGSKNSNVNLSFKLLELKELSLYWDTLNEASTCNKWSSKELLQKMYKFEDHKFLTNSINAVAKFKRQRCKEPIRSRNRPRISCEVVLPEVILSVSNVQYKEMVECVSGLYNIKKIRNFRILRPMTPISSGSAIRWWQYAAKCHGFTFRSPDEKSVIARENLRYMQIYQRILGNPSENLSKEDKQLKHDVERARTIDEISLLRSVCYENQRSRGRNSRFRNVLHGKGILYHWFPNWMGWYGVSDNSANSLQLENDDTYKNMEDEILSALKETIENDTFSKRDAIFGVFTFALSDVKIDLDASDHGLQRTMLRWEMKDSLCFVEVKPKLTSYKVGLSLGSISLSDFLTTSTEHVYIVRPLHQVAENQKSLYSDFLNFFSKKSAAVPKDEPWFQLQYERYPPDLLSDYRLIVKSKGIDVVYNDSAFRWLFLFFTQPVKHVALSKNVTSSIQAGSRLPFFKNWKTVLTDQKDHRKKWSFEIDITAPRIICVENLQERNSAAILIDFGRFQLFKNERSAFDEKPNDPKQADKDSDDELFMTPCSTPPGSKTSRSDSPTAAAGETGGSGNSANGSSFSKFVINNNTGLENELYSEMYDKYIVNLTDLQVLVCKNREWGFSCFKSSSNFHLLDKFNISLNLERRIVNTSDLDYPSIKLCGNIDKIVAHINEQKVSECLKILSRLSLNFNDAAVQLNSDKKARDFTLDDLQISNATILKFVIGQLIFELQSREKSIAEIQVLGAKAIYTRKHFETNVNLSVHGFLLVDAIQSFGPDFELLIASHRHVEMDSKSGSIKQSEPCSPTSPGSPDSCGYQRCASPNGIFNALNSLHTEIGLASETDDVLITIDINFFQLLPEAESVQIANVTFNNLDVIANQETIVELLGFGKRIMDNFKSLRKGVRHSMESKKAEPHSKRPMKLELAFDFHRLNILVLRSTRGDCGTIGRKVGTLTMSEAKIHATLGDEMCVVGGLGGIQIIDITPEGAHHQRIFSVGKDPLADPPTLYSNDMMYTLTNEMYGSDVDNAECPYANALNFKIMQTPSRMVSIRVRMASMWYIHCPRFIEEIYLCVKQFRQYFKNFVKSLRQRASNMAKGLVHNRSLSSREKNMGKLELSFDVMFSSPVLVLPQSSLSDEVLVANLGKISICNETKHLVSDNSSSLERHTYCIDVRNINLFSLNTGGRKDVGRNVLPKANEMYCCQSGASPILHNTALLFKCVYESKIGPLDTGQEPQESLLVDGSVTQNLHVSLSRLQYEQLLKSLKYAANIVLGTDSPSQIEAAQFGPNDVQLATPFAILQAQFSVPILSLDLKNEHAVSMVHLTFEEFGIKHIFTGDRRELKIQLRSVLMEDLKCTLISKYRNMVNSSMEPILLHHQAGCKMSISCPDLSTQKCYRTTSFSGSVPFCIHKVADVTPSLPVPVVGNVRKRNKNLVIYQSVTTKSAVKDGMEFVKSSIDFNCLNLIISTDKWFMVFDFFGLIASSSPVDELSTAPVLVPAESSSIQELEISVLSLNLILVRNETELARANVSNVHLKTKKNKCIQSIEGRLGSLSVYDLTSYGHLYYEKFSTTGTEALSFNYQRNTKNVSAALEKNAHLLIFMSSVKYVHTKRFVVELHHFVKELLQLQSPVMSRIKPKSLGIKVHSSDSFKIGLEIHAESPIIMIPVAHSSDHLLIADLGKITLRNTFQYSRNILVFDRQNGGSEIVDAMSVDLVDINLLIGERENQMSQHTYDDPNVIKIGNVCIIKLGETIFKEKCQLKIQVTRNMESDTSHNIPDIHVKATLSKLNGLLTMQQYKLIRGVLNFNIGESIDDVYYNYEVNVNESLERLSSMTKVNSVQDTSFVWKNMSLHFILDNVTIFLAEPVDIENNSLNTPLACIRFIKSTLQIDSYSNGSQDIDLISSEILLTDSRITAGKPSVKNYFKYILKPSMNSASSDSVQAEIRSRKRNGVFKYTILLNNMRIMALLDYLESFQRFISEEPYMADTHTKVEPSGSSTQKHRPTPRVEDSDTNTKTEFVLKISNSEVVFVEDCHRLDTNAIILKSTSEFVYRPNCTSVPISIDINHLEIFSCVLELESESSLSIIDPFSFNMELRNKRFQILCPHPVYLRVSYNDIILFSRMMHSIPNRSEGHWPLRDKCLDDTEKISPLLAMGFKRADCWTALRICDNNINKAALWLSQRGVKNVHSTIDVEHISVSACSLSICIIDDCMDADVPLLELALSRIIASHRINSPNGVMNYCKGDIESVISSNYYNRRLSGWEPIVESWDCCGSWKYSFDRDTNLTQVGVQVSSKQILKLNITSTLIELCELVQNNWTKDYVVRSCSPCEWPLMTSPRQRQPFVPFALRNLTGETLLFKIIYTLAGGITRTEVNQQDLMCNWITAEPGEVVPFDFGPQSKLRHMDSHKLNMHQILVQIHEWTLIGPISIDKVGTFFRYANWDIQYTKKTRIVFEITLVGSAQKMITVRSALNVVNSTTNMFGLHLKLRHEPERHVMYIRPLETISVPLRYVEASIYLKPVLDTQEEDKETTTNGARQFVVSELDGACARAIMWQNCLALESVQDIHTCSYINTVPFHVVSEIRKDNYPIRDTGPMPGHTITIMPPLRIKNLLCCDLLYQINGYTHGRVNASGEIEIYSIDIRDCFSLNITLDNYKLSGQIKIPMGHSGVVEPKLKLVDVLNRELFLRVSIQSLKGRGMEIFIGAPLWIINKTGLPLIFRQEGTTHPASGQFQEHEHARELSPLMFSFSDQEGSPLIEFRLGRTYGYSNPWSKSVGLQKETTFRELRAENSKINYVVGVNVERGKGPYSCTTFVTLSPRFQLFNRSTKTLQFAQKCDVKPRTQTPANAMIVAPPGSNFPFHWSNGEQESLLCVKNADDPECLWSNGLPVNEVRSLYINLRNELGDMSFLRLEVVVYGGTYMLQFTDAQTLPPPIRVDNYSEVPIYFSQKDTDPNWRTTAKPQSSLSYVLDDPLGSHILRLEAPGGNSIDYNLHDDSPKSLTYANFIYIAFKATFANAFSECDAENEDFERHQLVLGVRGKYVVISRKCHGDRSQLWLMNSFGHLEHEGSSPPTDVAKSAHQSALRLVLDLEKPPNPSEYTRLVVRPQNGQRITTQTWRFVGGRLMCHANMCVQAANGLSGLQAGCVAVLGRIECGADELNPSDTPPEQSIEAQKLRPGSGHLEVVNKIDGPIKSIRICDVKIGSEDVVLSPDSVWKHTSTFGRSQAQKCREHGMKDFSIKLSLPKGVGLSIVTRSPCEEIAYLTCEDIVLDAASSSYAKCLDLKVGDFQIDNQLLETPCPIMFYTSKEDRDGTSMDALSFKVHLLSSPNERAVIFEHFLLHVNPCVLLLEERLILKIARFLGYGGRVELPQCQTSSDVYKLAEYEFSNKAKRYYFESLYIGPIQVRLTVLTASKLSNELLDVKKSLGLTLIKFEDALIDLDKFSDRHHFETLPIYLKAMKVHYVNQLKWHAASILGSVDFLGNPLGFASDLSEGVAGLFFEGSVKSLVKNVTHGISDSTAKLTETLSDSLGRVVLDEHDNETRQKILEVSCPTTGGHLAAGLKGFGFGLLGGVTSIVRHTYVGAQSDGLPGFFSGLGKGLVGTVTKPLIGVLDLASETASAVRETSRGSHRVLPDRKRLPRCVTGAPGGLLPNFSYRQSKGQQYLYIINRRDFSEKLIFYEPNLCNDKEAKLRLLISTEFLRVFSRCDEDPAIMIECHLSEVLSCHPLTHTSGSAKITPSYYIEISTNLPKVTRPRVRCQNEEIADRASRFINYAKTIYDEREHTLAGI